MWLCVSITRKSTCTSLHLDSVRILKWHLTDSCLAFSCSTISFCSSVSPETFSILAYSLRILNVSLVVVSEAYENWPFGYLTDIFLFFFAKKGKSSQCCVSMLALSILTRIESTDCFQTPRDACLQYWLIITSFQMQKMLTLPNHRHLSKFDLFLLNDKWGHLSFKK